MRLDVVLPNEGRHALEAVRSAPLFEEMGFQGLWLTDHVIGLEGYRPVYGDYWLEILNTLSYLAGTTKKIRLGTGVLVIPYRDPVLTAKMLATIDVLSGGRVDLGIGTGWSRREFIALGRGDIFEDRGAVTDEALDVFMTCWKGGEFSHNGRWSKSSKIRFHPVPVQTPRIPFWIGARGLAPAPLRRAAKYADFWHPSGVSPEDMKIGGEKLDSMAGRKIPRTIRMKIANAADGVDLLRRYQDSGCVQAAIDFSDAATFADFVKVAEATVKTPL